MARNKRVSRNGPCPCGSGKKYKGCCLQRDQIVRKGVTELSKRIDTLVELESLVTEALFHGTDFSELEAEIQAPPSVSQEELWKRWLLYDAHIASLPEELSDKFVEEHILPAQNASFVGLWSIEESEPGFCVSAKELFTGKELTIFTRRRVYGIYVARVAVFGELAIFAGLINHSLTQEQGEAIVEECGGQQEEINPALGLELVMKADIIRQEAKHGPMLSF